MATRRHEDHAKESVSLWFRLLSCHARMLAELRRQLDQLEGSVTMPRFDLLASLLRRDGQTLAALSRELLVTAGNVTGLVDRAERDGLVLRRPDPTDRRLARVWLTPHGRELIAGLLPAHAAQVHALVVGMPAAERRALRELLGSLRDHLASQVDRPPAGRNEPAGSTKPAGRNKPSGTTKPAGASPSAASPGAASRPGAARAALPGRSPRRGALEHATTRATRSERARA